MSESVSLIVDGMCLWESMIEARQMDKEDATEMSQLWENNGAGEMRNRCALMLGDLNTVWDSLSEGIRDSMSYDWEFCPMFLRHVHWFDQDSNPERISAEIKAVLALGV